MQPPLGVVELAAERGDIILLAPRLGPHNEGETRREASREVPCDPQRLWQKTSQVDCVSKLSGIRSGLNARRAHERR